MIEETDKPAINLYKVLLNLRQVDNINTTFDICLLLYACVNPGKTITEIASEFGVIRSQAFQSMERWDGTLKTGKKRVTKEYLRKVPNPMDARSFLVYPTKEGKALAKKLIGG